ncbi:hypothetical protein C8R45DRAFT_87563 [Mycena sanguinolenta]|nr:hypothetical protein C8R45DRAFT_87563 [Mycena sanguinolenta]
MGEYACFCFFMPSFRHALAHILSSSLRTTCAYYPPEESEYGTVLRCSRRACVRAQPSAPSFYRAVTRPRVTLVTLNAASLSPPAPGCSTMPMRVRACGGGWVWGGGR